MRYSCALTLILATGIASATRCRRARPALKTVFEEIMASSDKSIPRDLLEGPDRLVIVPSLKRGGFIVGAQYGVGVATPPPGRWRLLDRTLHHPHGRRQPRPPNPQAGKPTSS